MAFAIMRCKKIKTAGGVASSLQHCFRERETHNADPERLSENKHGVADSVDSAMGKMRERLPEKRRKDAVLMVEYMMTASPEWFAGATKEDQRDFFNKSFSWLCDKYGRENVIVATIHNDETTPHMSAFVTPVTKDGRLSAKEFIGNKKKMSDDQTSYAEKVESLGLQRGIKGSNAKHQSIRQYYELVNKELEMEYFSSKELKPKRFKGKGLFKFVPIHLETPEGIALRISKKFKQVHAVASNLRRIEGKANRLEQLYFEADDKAKKANKALARHILAEEGLTKSQLEELARIREVMKKETKERHSANRNQRVSRRGFKI